MTSRDSALLIAILITPAILFFSPILAPIGFILEFQEDLEKATKEGINGQTL